MDDKNEYEYGVDYVKEHSKQGKELEAFQDNLQAHFKQQDKEVEVFVPQMWGGFSIIVRVASTFKAEASFLSLDKGLEVSDAFHKVFGEDAVEVGYRQRLTFTYLGNWTKDQFAQVEQFCKDNL